MAYVLLEGKGGAAASAKEGDAERGLQSSRAKEPWRHIDDRQCDNCQRHRWPPDPQPVKQLETLTRKVLGGGPSARAMQRWELSMRVAPAPFRLLSLYTAAKARVSAYLLEGTKKTLLLCNDLASMSHVDSARFVWANGVLPFLGPSLGWMSVVQPLSQM